MYVANIGNSGRAARLRGRAADPRRQPDPGPGGRPAGAGARPTSTGPSTRSRRSPSRSPATGTTTCSRSTSSPTSRPHGRSTGVGSAGRRGPDHRRRRPAAPERGLDIRLEVHQPDARDGRPAARPGCAEPRSRGTPPTTARCPRARTPNLVGCSMILSGLRVFDIRDVRHPKEVGYFNKPIPPGDKPDQPRGAGRATRCRSPRGTPRTLGLVHRRATPASTSSADQRPGHALLRPALLRVVRPR